MSSYRKEKLVNGEIYHIVLRALDNNLIFKNKDDYYRGIFSIYEFNNAKPITIQARRKARINFKKKTDKKPLSIQIDGRDKLVEILSFTFMPNHPHLLLRQIKNNGISKFMMKIGAGYGGYFNRKYHRKGHVFQNRFLSVHIKDEKQLKVVFAYINVNPLSLIEPNWKEKGIKNLKKISQFLENYKWSSYGDYIGKKNFPSVTDREFILRIMGGEKGCKELVENWIKHKTKLRESPKLFLEE